MPKMTGRPIGYYLTRVVNSAPTECIARNRHRRIIDGAHCELEHPIRLFESHVNTWGPKRSFTEPGRVVPYRRGGLTACV
jgi:hypothetical protein